MYQEEAKELKQIIDKCKRIVIIQADNPDADSLGSALALEHILGDLGKEPLLYCAVDMPNYLRYLSGWDRVSAELPNVFDASIIVDASTLTLLDRLVVSGKINKLAGKPCLVLDHHESVDNAVNFASTVINDASRASTGELIYMLCHQLEWSMSLDAQGYIMMSILGDTQGLSNQLTSPTTYRLMGDMVEAGVDRPSLEELRREFSKMPPEIYKYKAELIKRTVFSDDGKIAFVNVPNKEIREFSPLYNPGPLIQYDMLQTTDVAIAIVLKNYDSGKVTAAIRCNPGAGIAAQLAEHFGGGGHAFASGFKVEDGRSYETIRDDCLKYATQLLANLTSPG